MNIFATIIICIIVFVFCTIDIGIYLYMHSDIYYFQINVTTTLSIYVIMCFINEIVLYSCVPKDSPLFVNSLHNMCLSLNKYFCFASGGSGGIL